MATERPSSEVNDDGGSRLVPLYWEKGRTDGAESEAAEAPKPRTRGDHKRKAKKGKKRAALGSVAGNNVSTRSSKVAKNETASDAAAASSAAASSTNGGLKRGRRRAGSEAWKEEAPQQRITRAQAREHEEAAKRSAAASAEFAVVVDEALRNGKDGSCNSNSTGPVNGIVAGHGLPRGHHVIPIPQGVEDVENRHLGEPQYCEQYVKDIFSYLRSLQFKYPVSVDFMSTEQPKLDTNMRAILVDWLVEVADEYKLLPDTLYIAVNYIDRCLNSFPVERRQLQLLGCGCMLIAAKYEEIFPPAIDEFVYISDNTYTREEILRMEGKVLSALNFKLTVSSAKNFLRRFQRAAHVKAAEKNLCNYLSELTLQSYEFVRYTPSLSAAACLLLARIQLYDKGEGQCLPPNFDRTEGGPEPWTKNLVHYTGYEQEELHYVLHRVHKLQVDAPKETLQAIREKYSHAPFMRISRLKALPRDLLPEVTPSSIREGGR